MRPLPCHCRLGSGLSMKDWWPLPAWLGQSYIFSTAFTARRREGPRRRRRSGGHRAGAPAVHRVPVSVPHFTRTAATPWIISFLKVGPAHAATRATGTRSCLQQRETRCNNNNTPVLQLFTHTVTRMLHFHHHGRRDDRASHAAVNVACHPLRAAAPPCLGGSGG